MKRYIRFSASVTDIQQYAEELSDYIDETGKTRWSAKDIYEHFADEGVKLTLEEILDVWHACPNPVCACTLEGCDKL